MKKVSPVFLTTVLLLLSAVAVAQSQLSSWPQYVELNPTPTAGVYKFTVPLHVMGQSRDDLGDLRLFDEQNREIPYAIRILQTADQRQETGSKLFNRATVGSASEATVDLGDNPGEHNEVEVETTGGDFRRQVTVEGSDSGREWRMLRSDGVVFNFASSGRNLTSTHVKYSASRYRYVRVRVSADELSDDGAPEITNVKVSRAFHQEGVLSTWSVFVPDYQLWRNQGAHSSSWTIDFGQRLPCSQLSLTISDPSFYRPFQVENVDDPQNPRLLASGNLSRRADEEAHPQVITFDQEEHVQRVKLQVTDYSNQTLNIESINAAAPLREVVFELKQSQSLPLRLYFGNQKVTEPHYDFEKELDAKLKTKVSTTAVGNSQRNAAYTPEPLPFTERLPWLIYLVLAASSVVLGWILWSLTKTVLKRDVEQQEGSRQEQ
jgi:hypothetical protein